MAVEIETVGGLHIKLPAKSKNPLIMKRNATRLADLIRRYKVDIVHARSRAPAWSAWAAARRTGKPFVTTFHNAYGAKSAAKRLYNSIMARGDRVIAISNFVGEYAQSVYGVPREKLRVIPRGVDIARFDPTAVGPERIDALRRAWNIPPGAPVVMLPGRLTRWKGQLVLIEAFTRLERHDVICVIVGGGDAHGFRREIENAASRYRLDPLLRIVDECRDMPAAYALADIVVSASTRPEGFGRVIIEAQAMGKPVIATDHGGARESIVPGETGFLVPPGNPATLAEAITQVLNLAPEARADLAQHARAHIRANFTTDLMTARTLAVYDELKR